MNLAFAVYCEPRLTSVPHTILIVFVVDDDISMRESLEELVRRAGTFASRAGVLGPPAGFCAKLLGA